METAETLEDLLHAASRGGIPAVHLLRDGDQLRVLVRTVSGLAQVRSVVASQDWFVAAQLLPGAVRRGDRIVIDLTQHDSVCAGFAELGMPASMRSAIGRETHAPGGVILIGSEDADVRHAVMTAAAHAPGERHVITVDGDRADLDAAARMDCDAILLSASDDRALLSAAFDHAQRGARIILGVDAPDVMAAIARLRAARLERHLLAFGLRVAVAARTVPGLCPVCRRPAQAAGSDCALLGVDPGTVIYRAAGCGVCDGTGYSDDVTLFETVTVDPGLRRLLAEGGDIAILARHAFVRAPTLAGSARALAREGRIAVEAAIAATRAAGGGASIRSPHPHVLIR